MPYVEVELKRNPATSKFDIPTKVGILTDHEYKRAIGGEGVNSFEENAHHQKQLSEFMMRRWFYHCDEDFVALRKQIENK